MSTYDKDDGSNASVTVDIDTQFSPSTSPVRSSAPKSLLRQNSSGSTNNNDNNNNNKNKNNRSSQSFSINSSHQNNTLTSQSAINTLNAIRSLQNQTDSEKFSVDAWMPDKEKNIRPDGLPTLDQVLRRQTLSPLSQYNLYTYLRTRQKAEENLNFWIDIDEHEKLWKQYEAAEAVRRQKDRKDQSRRESDRAQKKRERLSQLLGPAFEAMNNEDEIEKIPDLTPPPPVATVDPMRNNMTDAEREAAYEEEMKYFESRRSPTLSTNLSNRDDEEAMLLNSRRGSRSATSLIKDPSNVTFNDMLKNAERIYRRYCSPFDTSNRIPLPEDYRLALHELIEIHKQPHPLVFQSAKLYTEELIDNYYYQKFLDSATKSNLTRVHSTLALFLGVIALTAGFSLELVFIFLGSGGYTQRVWGLIPLLFGWLLLITAVEKFLVILTIFRYSETTFFRFHRIKEPAIQQRHNRKALRLTFIILLATVITTAIFIVIPKHTLPSSS